MPACAHDEIAYNSCRNRHCPKCQASAAKRWLEARQTELLPVDYYHVVFTLPAPISAIAYTNKAAIYRFLFEVAAETLHTIAVDSKHLGARIGATLVLHTWGSALTHHPHVHGIVPGGGLSFDGLRWIACKRGFFLPVRVLSRLFRRRFLEEFEQLHRAGQLQCFGEYAQLSDATAFAEWIAPLRKCEWVVYAKRPFAGPAAVLAYLSRYTHRVAIANSGRRANLALARELLNVAPLESKEFDVPSEAVTPIFVCRDCGAAMIVTGILARAPHIRAPPSCLGAP